MIGPAGTRDLANGDGEVDRCLVRARDADELHRLDEGFGVSGEDLTLRTAEPAAGSGRPRLVYVYGRTSDASRRVEGFVAQVLQRRRNHERFRLIRVCAEEQPALVERLAVREVPTLLVIEHGRVRARLAAPRGKAEIEQALAPWLR